MEAKNSKLLTTALLLIVFAVFFLRLFQLQIVDGKTNRFLAENNRIARIKIEAPRGLILDRRGEILAKNEPVYVLQEKETDKGQTITRQEALLLQSEGNDAELRIKLRRLYPQREVFSHVIGYLGEVTEKELKEGKMDLKGYRQGNLLGRVGLEAAYEEELAGREGSEVVEVDTQGKIIRRMGRILPSAGKTLTLAIDKKVQEVAAKAMEGKRGAVVAANPQTGEILAFYSSPSFDPTLFSPEGDRDELVGIINDETNRPLLNRVIAGLFAPGSTFKIVTSIAGLEEEKITARTLINDPGVITVGDFKYHNWYFTSYGKTEGEVDLAKALARSTDTYFYKLGEMTGIEKIVSWAEKFGVNKKTGIDLPGELAGFIATPEWKKRVKGESWFLGNTYHIAIGQGDLSLTPLAVNQVMAVIASGGKICQPRMLRLGAENTPYEAECREVGIKKEYLKAVEKGLIAACSEGGTGWPFFGFKPQVACKTGTAEIGEEDKTHAWFTVYAPVDNPEIVLTVLVERGGEGSSVAGPIAKEILEEYFNPGID